MLDLTKKRFLPFPQATGPDIRILEQYSNYIVAGECEAILCRCWGVKIQELPNFAPGVVTETGFDSL